MRILKTWLQHKWMVMFHPELLKAYATTFSSYHGQLVLQHLLDHIYFTVYTGIDAEGAALHNARRSVIHELLMNIDAAEHPEKYTVKVEQESTNAP